MLDRTRLLAGSLVLGSLLLGASITTPSFAEQKHEKSDDGGYYNDDGQKCLSVKQAEKRLKRMKYKELSYDAQYSKEGVYFFVGIKPKRDGKIVVWHLYYDGCERELVAKQSQE